jgi:hypothetical protein
MTRCSQTSDGHIYTWWTEETQFPFHRGYEMDYRPYGWEEVLYQLLEW